MASAVPRPFVKWAGGKKKMLPFIMSSFPDKVKTYYEPFLGGGSVFFEMLRQGRFKKAVIGDSNAELANAFQVVQSDVEALISELQTKRYKYDRRVYLKIRAENSQDSTAVAQAARFIYLNKTCFNGLYRVNLDGRFNTPFGKYDDPLICDAENLRAVSKALKGVTIICQDFAQMTEKAKLGDGVYFDPPYLPISETSSFTGYNAGGFGEEDHWRLRGLFGRLVKAGVSVVLSNSLCDTTREMYSSFNVRELTGSRVIGGPASYRNSVKEMMVVGGPVPSLPEIQNDSP